MSKKHVILKGTLILTATGFATRFMGFFYRIFLSQTFGEEGVGLYQLIFPVYALCFSLTSAGIEIALSRCVASRISKNQKNEARSLLYTGLMITILSSCIITVLLQKYSYYIAEFILKDNRCADFLVIMSYAFPFAAFHSCVVGYYLGQKQTRVPASSQLIEQTVRIFSVWFIFKLVQNSGSSIGISVAVIGLVLGEIASSFYCLIKIRNGRFLQPVSPLPFSVIFKNARELCILSIPLTANRVLLNILQSIESISIPLYLQKFGMSNEASLSNYGVLTGMALPCILFPSAVTNSVSSMLLPTVAEMQTLNNKKGLSSLIGKTACSCILLGSVCCMGLLICGNAIGTLLFGSELAGKFIVTLAWMCPFLYTNTTLVSIINGLGKTNISFFINASSLGIRILSIFMIIPEHGIFGYLCGLLVSQVFVFLISCFYLIKYLKRK